ncbi:MAG: hypothetical protein K8U57_03515 [Planctomycetes bacterium]|nr:hypothetical protein [Planctomycetota bacterium]
MDPLKEDVVVLARVAADQLDSLPKSDSHHRSLISQLTRQLRSLTQATPSSEILESYQAVCASGLFPPNPCFFLMQKVIHDCYIIEETEDEDEDEDDDETSEGSRTVTEASVYARHGENEMSQLCLDDPDEFDQRRISGYSYFFEPPSENKGGGYQWMDIDPDRARSRPGHKNA